MNDQRRTINNEDWQNDLAAYSLGALDSTEAAEFAATLTTDDERTEAAAYTATVEALALAAPLRVPPVDMEKRLLARLDAPSRLRIAWRRVAPWLAAAAMFMLAAGLGVKVWQQQGQISELKAVLTAPQMVGMENTEIAPNAQGRFYLAPQSRQALLVLADMPSLADDKAYQLWLVGKDNVRDDGGTFRVDEKGYATHLVTAPRAMSEYMRIGVTTEPRGGSPGPTSGRVVGASLEKPLPTGY